MKKTKKLVKELKSKVADLKGQTLEGDAHEDIHTALDEIEDRMSALHSKAGLKKILQARKVSADKVARLVAYEDELEKLQVEIIKLQNWALENNKRIAIIFEGRDTAGKGGAIKRFTEHLNPRHYRVVALPKPSDVEKGQFYFQRYMKELPNPGEIVFFDRSWYNRAVVEPVMGFCNEEQYGRFMREAPEFEHMLIEDGIVLIKFWFSISKDEQHRRFEGRKTNPLKHWKLSPVDKKAQTMWDKYTHYKEEMFAKTHTGYSPWIIIKADDKKKARLESIRYVLSLMNYEGKKDAIVSLNPDPEVVSRYHRANLQLD